ncbi:Uncharacterised protein [Klebsiella pneumoniae]|uniref:Host cell division inhibitor Icd-like protein n=3 Tax=Klebsiella/Raoultella group TaxID=2890311 RepID=A0A378A497_KLEPN|nr:hypothetical protein UUU_39030 [Klebsiella pneumoniae subsp. pneumoniae DSM 30104 = JCM 1662 = NBRC 14940]KFJ75196.1 hypothetical protein DR88_2860 [Klebsiella pneumoniae]CAD5235979.1 hypothetical protein JCHPOGMJ_00010 [Escherichia phage vB_KppS-Ant]SQC82808.1 Uncharacterised protein [Klebsiella pneumoniae subsp. pneumoniae]KHF70716.1 hypothetical protein LV59_01064 [Klebsiella pneumoniae]
MTGKTKAAMPGRLSLNALLKHRQITRLAAGGQTLSQRNPYAQINRVRLTYGHRNPLKELDYNESLESAGNKHEQYSGSPEHQHCLGSEVPTNNVESCEDNQPSLRGEPLHNALRVAQNNPSLRGAVHSITESNPVQLSGSDLAFLRCSDLSLRPQASRTHAEKLAPALSAFSRSTLASISSISSCGNRIFFCADLAFTALVAIYPPAYSEGTPYQKNSLTCTPTENIVGVHLEVEDTQDTAKPGSVTSTNRASDHNVTEAYIMACIQHTQTRPKYQYRFLALSAIGRNVIHITATTEREAREQSPDGCVMVFAGRLPVREGHHA